MLYPFGRLWEMLRYSWYSVIGAAIYDMDVVKNAAQTRMSARHWWRIYKIIISEYLEYLSFVQRSHWA